MRTPSSSSSTWWGWSIAWVGLLLSLQVAAEAQSNARSWGTTTATFHLPHHDHDQYGERAVNVAYDTRRTVGQDFWQCCKWTWPPQNASAVAHPEIRSLDCSILERSEEFDDQGTGIRSAADFCLHVCGFSSIHRSYIVGVDASEPLRADAAVSLALYLANRSSTLWPADVLARVACRREHAPCRLTIAGAATIAMSGGLGFVEWMGRFSGSQAYYEVAHPSRFEFAFRVSTPLADQVQGFGRRSLLERRGIPRNVAFFHWQSLVLGMLMSLAGVSTVAVLCAGKKGEESPSAFLDTVTILPPRFSYSKLQKATKNYYQKLGDGAFGSVYEGTLPNGVRVAVKMLEKASVQGEKQFRAEVASMGAIRHLNLVRLHGFCSEGSHRLLVYEFMPNGSLDSWLFGKKQGEKLLDWEQRLNIALGTARALAYLHEECSDHIIHLDVKPENILLDHQFCPKLSDFGLAKLMDREQSRVVTSMRGTPGYLAPEWLLPQAAVTAKTDVYSFGMVLLELISGRENTNFSLGKEQWYFPAWAFKLMSEGRTMELLDKRLHVAEVEYFHKEDAMRAIHVALLCIQDDPAARPPMSRVVHMLQGHVEPEPLNAQQSAINPPRRLMTAFAASGADANPKENITSINNNNNNNNNHHNDSTNGDLPRKSRSDPRRDSRADPRSDLRRDSRADSKSSRDDSRKNSWSNENDPILTELQKDMRNDYYNRMTPAAATTPILSSRLPAVTESPPPPSRPPRHSPSPPTTHHARHPHELSPNADSFKLEPRESPPPLQMLPPAVQGASHHRLNTSDRRAAGAHALGSSNHKCIPPWPVQGDVILLRGGGGAAGHADFLAVVRAVREQSKLMRLALLQRGASDARLVVRAEESAWRHWNESIRTLDFWVAVRWAAVPGRGFEKFPVEWQLR